MSWFWFSIIALLMWSGSDLFSKIGCRHATDKLSHLKMVTAVGLVMGIHAGYEIFFGGVEITGEVLLAYLPVSALYILSMVLGYISLRYIELSISSPICNSSGALVAIMTIFMVGISDLDPLMLAATALVCVGVIGLGFVEYREDDELRALRQDKANFRYSKSVLAILLPLLYCLLDAAGTFADSLVLQKIDENSANVAYELTFFIVGIFCFIFAIGWGAGKAHEETGEGICKSVAKGFKKCFFFKREASKLIGATFETIGQFAYIMALADETHVMYSAPIISAYCVASVVWSSIFLKEKLSIKHYIMIGLVVVGVIIIGTLDP